MPGEPTARGGTYVDASAFLGMHSTDPRVRASCAAFFGSRGELPVVMTYEEIGRCDDTVWAYPRETQDAYYPFMDVLHTVLPVRRRAYTERDLAALAELPAAASSLTPRERLLLAAVSAAGGELVTVNPRLLPLRADGLPVRRPADAAGPPDFPECLGGLYRRSLVLEVDHARI
jgi:hypothetical protein